MKTYGKKLTALLLVLCMALGLAACGGDSGGGSNPQQLSGTVYVPEFIDCDLEVDYVNSACSDGQYIYLVADVSEEIVHNGDGSSAPQADTVDTASTVIGSADMAGGEPADSAATDDGTWTEYINRTGLFRVSLDGKEVTELENYTPSLETTNGDDGYCNINGIRTGSDGTLWISENAEQYQFELPADFNAETDDKWNYYTGSISTQLQRQLDSTGNELQRLDTSGLAEKLGVDYVNNTLIDNEGNFYVSTDTQMHVLDKDMNILFTLDGENLWGQMVLLSDGTVGLKVWGSEGGQTLKTVDKAAKAWGTEYPMPVNSNNVYTGGGDYLFYYDNGDSLYGYQADAQEGKKILSWSSSDINVDNLMFFTILSDGRVVAMTRNYRGSDGPTMEMAILTETDASVLADKTILTFATMYTDYDTRAKIIDFNKKSTTHRIEIRDYSEYNTADDYEAGMTKLNTEIVAGNVPDILNTSGLSISQYAAKGLLEDLWPLIENDPDLGRENLMERVFDAASMDGKLYQVFDSFGIRTVVGATKVVGESMSWNLDALQAALATMPEGCQIFSEGDTKSSMLNSVLNQNLGSYVDWSTGQCSFDSDQFKAALEFCNSFPLEYDWSNVNWDEYEDDPTRIAAGKQMLMTLSLTQLSDVQMYEAIFGGQITYVGYPTEDGSCGSSFTINDGLAMSSKCADKEAAWSFMRQLLLPQEENDNYRYYRWQFPTNKADFDKLVEEAMKVEYELDENGKPLLDENGQPIQVSQGSWGWGSIEIEIKATTQEQYDQFMALYNTVDSIYTYDTSIYEIVNEEAASYFNGDKSLDEVASLIQSRVNIYVNEQR